MSKQKFTRTNIQEIIRSGAGLDIRQARAITARIIGAMAGALASGAVIELRGLGTFLLKSRKPRSILTNTLKKPWSPWSVLEKMTAYSGGGLIFPQ